MGGHHLDLLKLDFGKLMTEINLVKSFFPFPSYNDEVINIKVFSIK